MLVELKDSEYDALVKDHSVIVYDFWAEWCGPCKQFKPVFEEVSAMEGMEDVVFAKVDVESNPGLAAKFGIRSIPTVLFMKNEQVVHSVSGVLPKDALVNGIEALIKAEV